MLDHSHNAQWGVVLDGQMELTINGQTKTLTKGDSYYIEKDVIHSAKIKKGYKDLTLFDQADRYKEENWKSATAKCTIVSRWASVKTNKQNEAYRNHTRTLKKQRRIQRTTDCDDRRRIFVET